MIHLHLCFLRDLYIWTLNRNSNRIRKNSQTIDVQSIIEPYNDRTKRNKPQVWMTLSVTSIMI